MPLPRHPLRNRNILLLPKTIRPRRGLIDIHPTEERMDIRHHDIHLARQPHRPIISQIARRERQIDALGREI